MFNKHRSAQFEKFNEARKHFISNPSTLIKLEKFFSDAVVDFVTANIADIKRDYNEASYLYPFWQNYPPDERGRMPKGDQFPWIEVGEHTFGAKLPRYFESLFSVKDTGVPTGSDQRFVLSSKKIKSLIDISDSAWLFVDIKSVGPRDDQPHTVMSHNQISGDGVWTKAKEGMRNTVLKATGARASHDFHCSLPPLYVLSDGTMAPVVIVVIKPVYTMLSLSSAHHRSGMDSGQPLHRVTIVTIPNGLLLTTNPNYLKTYPQLLFPGKDDKEKNPLKVRSRISFDLLQKIDTWRVRDINVPLP